MRFPLVAVPVAGKHEKKAGIEAIATKSTAMVMLIEEVFILLGTILHSQFLIKNRKPRVGEHMGWTWTMSTINIDRACDARYCELRMSLPQKFILTRKLSVSHEMLLPELQEV